MAETKDTVAKAATSAKKGGSAKFWIIGLLLVIALMGVANVLYMKKVKDLEKKAADKADADKAAADTAAKKVPAKEEMLVGAQPKAPTAATTPVAGKEAVTTTPKTKSVSANMSKAV